MDRQWTIWTLDHDHAEGASAWVSIPISSLPVTGFKMTFRNRAADEVRLTVETPEPFFYPSDIWSYFTRGRLYWFSCAWKLHGNIIPNRPMFCGTLVSTSPNDSGPAQSAEFLFLGGWYYLEQTIYRDRKAAGQILENNPIVSFDYAYLNPAIRSILWSASNGRGELAYLADDDGIGIFYPNSPTPNQGLITSCVNVKFSPSWDMKLPPMQLNSHTCAEALTRILSFLPDVHVYSWFSSTVSMTSSGTPIPSLWVERVLSDSDIDPPSINEADVDNPDAFPDEDPAGYSGTTMVFGSGQLISRRIEIPTHPACPGVRVYQTDTQLAYTAGNPDLPGGLTVAVGPEDSDGTFMFFKYIFKDGTEAPASSLPGEIYRLLDSPFWRGTLVLVGEDPPGLFTVRPNKYLSPGFPHSHPPAPIQSVEFDMSNGQTTIDCGWPGSPTIDSILSLVKANRYRYQWGKLNT